MHNALVHEPGDQAALESHFRSLARDPALVERLRKGALEGLDEITWSAAAARLAEIYRDVIHQVGHPNADAPSITETTT
jgi:hypothetical protein